MITYIISLIYFSKHNTLQVHPCCCKTKVHSFLWLSSIPLCVCVRVCMCVCVCTYIFFIHSPIDVHLGWFHILAMVNNAALNIVVHTYFQISVFVFFRYIPRRGLGGSYGSFIFSYLRTYHTVFYRLHQFTLPPTRHKCSLSSTPSPTSEILSAWYPS